MGRPKNGELLIADHHWTTRWLLLLLLGLAWFALAVVAIGFVRHLLNRGAVSELAPMIVAFYTYGSWCGLRGGSARIAGLQPIDCAICST
jgi:hypothetical protein